MKFTGKGRGKLLLSGEHIVFYGYPALGIPLPLETTVTLTILPKNTGKPGLLFPETMVPEWRTRLDTLFQLYCRELKILFQNPVVIEIMSDIPAGSGLGSSAALSAALLNALIHYPDYKGNADWSLGRIRQLAQAGESVFHGNSSGIDTCLALSETPLTMEPPAHGDITKISRWTINPVEGFPFYLIAGTIPRCENTAILIRRLREKSASGDRDVLNEIHGLGNLSRRMVRLFSGETAGTSLKTMIQELGHTASESEKSLNRLGLGHPVIGKILSTGLQAGAFGGKTSGAGGGGAFYLAAADAESTGEIYHRVNRILSETYPPSDYTLNPFYYSNGKLCLIERLAGV